jgi:hypothetical protein
VCQHDLEGLTIFVGTVEIYPSAKSRRRFRRKTRHAVSGSNPVNRAAGSREFFGKFAVTRKNGAVTIVSGGIQAGSQNSDFQTAFHALVLLQRARETGHRIPGSEKAAVVVVGFTHGTSTNPDTRVRTSRDKKPVEWLLGVSGGARNHVKRTRHVRP